MTTTWRADRLLGNLGYGSRKEIAELVRQKRLTRREMPLTRADEKIGAEEVLSGDIRLDGEPLDPPSPLTLMLHKPKGYSCSHDEKGALIYDLLPPRWLARKPALSAAGRLDKDSTGQVILTDDGELLHRIVHPRQHAAKYYAVTLEKPLTHDEAALFGTGAFRMQDDPKPLKPALWSETGEKTGVMRLQEGRYHQIRRMFETLGNRVTALHRYRTGGLALGEMTEGSYRLLSEDELSALFTAETA